jgi:hypothetical protein
MKNFEAIFKTEVYKFKAANAISANEMAKQYRDENNLGNFKLIQFGL